MRKNSLNLLNLTKHMAFGIDAGISRSTNNSVQTTDKIGNDGTILEMTTHGGAEEITEEGYVDAESFTNEAVNGQQGSSAVTSHNLTESNSDYAKVSKTTRSALAAPSA